VTSDKEHLETRLKTALDHMDQLQVANIELPSLLCFASDRTERS